MSLRSFLLFFALTLVQVDLHGQPISFFPPTSCCNGGLYLPIPANAFAIGDFNRDGRVDLVAVGGPQPGFGVTAVTVSPGNGDGTFQPPKMLLASNTSGNSPVAADFNGDGNLDIAILQFIPSAAQPVSLATFLGNGDGTFRPALVTMLPFYAATLIATDLNRDDRPDIVAGQTVLLGNGDGTFQTRPALDAPASLSADFNQDGKADLLLVLASGQLALTLGNGDGTFGKDLPLTTPFVPGSFVAGDFNGDGRVDLAISPTMTEACVRPSCPLPVVGIAVLRGNGDGTFQLPLMTANSMGPILTAADMNGDGKLD